MKRVPCSACYFTSVWVNDHIDPESVECSRCHSLEPEENPNQLAHDAEARQENINAMAARIYERAVAASIAETLNADYICSIRDAALEAADWWCTAGSGGPNDN